MARVYYEQLDPKSLRPFSLNEPTFGNIDDDLDEDFLESVRLYGVLTPPLVTVKKLILSGHRRIAAAIQAGITSISCKVTEETDPQVWKEIWAEQNRQREMTVEQRGRYYMTIQPIIAASAKERQKAGKTTGSDLVMISSQGSDDRKTRHVAAEQAGLTQHSAPRVAETIAVIDEALAEGDEKTAKELRRKLENDTPTEAARSARAAKAAKEPAKEQEPAKESEQPTDANGKVLPKHLIEIFEQRTVFADALSSIAKTQKAFNVLLDEKYEQGTIKLNKQQAKNDLKNFHQQIKFAIPFAICPYCKGSGKKDGGGCQCCKGVGWVVRDTYNQAPDDLKG